MKPLLKKALAAVAVKEAFERVQEMRAPQKPSLAQRLKPVALLAGLGGLAAYLFRSGRLNALLGRDSQDHNRPWETPAYSAPAAPSDTAGLTDA